MDADGVYQVLLLVYNSTFKNIMAYIWGYHDYHNSRFDLLTYFPLLCRAGLKIFKSEIAQFLQEKRIITFTDTGKKAYTFVMYPNGYIPNLNPEDFDSNYSGCQITSLNGRLFHIPEFTHRRGNQIIIYNKQQYNKFKESPTDHQCDHGNAREVILYNRPNFSFYLKVEIDFMYIYHVSQRMLYIYDLNEYKRKDWDWFNGTSTDNNVDTSSKYIPKKHSVKFNRLEEFDERASSYNGVTYNYGSIHYAI